MEIQKCNRNPYFLADFAYDGKFSDGERFCLRIPERDVLPFAAALMKAYVDDFNGDVKVTIPHVRFENGKAIFEDGKVERIKNEHNI